MPRRGAKAKVAVAKKKVDNVDASTARHRAMPYPLKNDPKAYEEHQENYRQAEGSRQWNPEHIWVTHHATENFNCITWSVANRWMNKEDDAKRDQLGVYDTELRPDLIRFYKEEGFVEVPRGENGEFDGATVLLYACSKNELMISHASVKYAGPRPEGMPEGLWESTLYPDITITHGKHDLEESNYGHIVAGLKRTTDASS